MISAPGVGSGMDVDGIVRQLMSVEKIPMQKLEKKEEALGVKLSALGKLSSALSDLKSSTAGLQDKVKLGHFVAESSNKDQLTATATSIDMAENHTVRISQLATNHRLTSSPYESPDAVIQTGTYTYSYGVAGENGIEQKEFKIDIGATNSTLAELKDAINRSKDNSGISASIVNATDGTHLVLTAKESGAKNAITASGGNTTFTEITAAQDAEIFVDGMRATPTSNTVTDVIPGITLELKSTGPDTLTVGAKPDKEAMLETMKGFTEAYNTLKDLMKELNEGDLKGEGITRGIESNLRTKFFSSTTNAEGEIHSSVDFGLTFDKYGALSLNESKFTDVVDSDLLSMIDFFSAEEGFSKQLNNTLDMYTKSDGLLNSRKKGFDSRVDSLGNQKERLEFRLEMVEDRYRKEFTTLDSMMAQLNVTSQQMNQQLATLPGIR
jgi:flagellar hook-associated protein 2